MKNSILLRSLCLVVFLQAIVSGQTKSAFTAARNRLVEQDIIGAGIKDQRVIEAIRTTQRHEFVPLPHRKNAYFDMALPIGDQQTISSPFIVAFMTQSLEPKPTDKVLEIGTGSGYQAAVLSPLVHEVYSIEIVERLGKQAASVLKRLKYENVFTKVGDGYQGWAEHAPFDKIIVTCSPEKVPQPLVDQLQEGGLMVIPVGERYQQTLYLLRKQNGKLESASLLPTLFVPMTGAAEESRAVKPDPGHPVAQNTGFEDPPDKAGFVPGWYYQRSLVWETSPDAPEGQHYISFSNDNPGQPAHLLQGFAIDGREVGNLEVSASVRLQDVGPGRTKEEAPAIAVTFYDQSRRELGTSWLGPFRGTKEWAPQSKSFRVPPQTREGILRIGLFGGVGKISFDQVQIKGDRK